ncbi:Endoglucanase 11 [Hibiscus syriacus]|uniref:cellulase n=1 Tax=Hibiscus syriacus TaxID=106335 RepID=A0A6A3C9U1_HIBSY|nr:Endoglucanase 11 [Hibiscus syriacus]
MEFDELLSILIHILPRGPAPRLLKKPCYDPIDYESIDHVDFWVTDEETLPELDIDEIDNFLYHENAIPIDKSSKNNEALSKSLFYFESQRSGRLPYNQRVTWRHHSGLSDGLEQGVDLVGGYYDAGDNVKFGLPMAFTITMLSWGVIEYGDEIAGAGEYTHALEAIKWGTDYFLKARTHRSKRIKINQTTFVLVGDGDTDHYCWQRPEDMTTSRQDYKVDERNPGSDVTGETTATMASASIVLFEFGDKYRGKYDESVRVVKAYYPLVSGFKDEMLWAALWLYKATDKDDYLRYALENANEFGGITWSMNEFSWDVKFAGLQIIASMLTKQFIHIKFHTFTFVEEKPRKMESKLVLEQYRSKAEHYLCSCLNKNNDRNVNRTRLVYCTSDNGTTYNMYRMQHFSSPFAPIISECQING